MPQNRKPAMSNVKGLSQPQVWSYLDLVEYGLSQINSGDPELLDEEYFENLAEAEQAIKPSNEPEEEEVASLNQQVTFIGE